MKENLQKYTFCMIMMSVIAIIIGIFMIMYPGISLATLGVIVALFMIINGAVLIYVDVKAWSYNVPFDGLLQGILRIVLGVLLIMNPDSMAVYIGIVMGIWIIISGFSGIKLAYHLRYTNAPWVLMIILNVLNILVGGAVLYSPVLSSMSLATAVGMVLIIYSILNIVFVFEVRKNIKEVEVLVRNQLEQLKQMQPVEAEVETAKEPEEK